MKNLDLFCRNCFRDLEIHFDNRENKAIALRDVDHQMKGFYCQKCYLDALKRLKNHRLAEIYNGEPIYQKDGLFVPYWESVYCFETLKDCKNRMNAKDAVFIPWR